MNGASIRTEIKTYKMVKEKKLKDDILQRHDEFLKGHGNYLGLIGSIGYIGFICYVKDQWGLDQTRHGGPDPASRSLACSLSWIPARGPE